MIWPTSPSSRALLGFIPALLLTVGCNTLRDNEALQSQQNDECTADEDCFGGLACSAAGLCAPFGNPGTQGRDASCAADTDCRFGLICNRAGVCAQSATGTVGDRCLADADCESSLRCAHDGTCLVDGVDGTAPAGTDCARDEECSYGLVCSPETGCTELPLWSGVTCEGSRLAGPPRVVFEIPRGRPNFDFYRLPFPNDVRRINGALDLSGYPGVDSPPEPGDFVSRFASALAGEATGFSDNAAVIFRFSTQLDFKTLSFGGDDPTFVFVDVTPNDDAFGRRPRSRFFATTDRSRYVCQNWLGIRPSEGSPLDAGHTYAVFFRRGITDDNGVPLEPEPDFAALMADAPPIDPAVAAAWLRYQPFRAWLATEGIPAEDVIGGTVFTTEDPTTRMAQMFPAVQNAPRPQFRDVVACEAGAASPCGTGNRGCGAPNELFTEIHAIGSLPSFLQGSPPYAEAGGRIVYVDGAPRAQRQEDVCLAATIPSGPAPPNGWPVVLFAHDVGGDFRSFVNLGLAADLARAGWAVLSYDGLLQGGRSGGTEPPDAATAAGLLDRLDHASLLRDQGLQATADLFSMGRLVNDLRLPAANGNTRFNPDKLVFFGHGRGGAAGVPFGAYALRMEGVVLASTGGGVVDRFRLTRQPADLGTALNVALADPELNGMHPGLHLLQHWLDPIDPVNFGDLLRHPPEGVPTKHVFMIYGAEDTATPGVLMNQLAVSARLPRVGTEVEPLQAISPLEEGIARGNVRSAGGVRTQALKQYAPDGDYDGSEVAFRHPEAKADLVRFLEKISVGNDAPEIAP